MYRRLPLPALVALAAAAAPCAAQQAHATLLRLTPPVGQVTHYRYLTEAWLQLPGATAADSSRPILLQMMYSTRTITGAHDSTWTSTIVIDSSNMRTASGDTFRGMTIRQTVDVHGTVDSAAVIPPPNASPMIADAMRKAGGLARSGLSLPPDSVHVGDSWTQSRSVTVPSARGPQQVSAHTTYRLERIDRHGGAEIAVISSRGSFSTDSTGDAPFTKGISIGSYRLDLDASSLVSETTDVEMRIVAQAGTARMHLHSAIESLQ